MIEVNFQEVLEGLQLPISYLQMIHLIHGDNTKSSREELFSLKSKHKQSGGEVITINGVKIDLTDVIQATSSVGLFSTSRLVIIESLDSRPKSQLKTDIISHLASLSHDPLANLIVWEDHALTNAAIKHLNPSTQNNHKLKAIIFDFLDSLSPGNQRMFDTLHQVLATEPAEMVFVQLVRQIRLLIMVKDATLIKLPPWQLQKLEKQAKNFTLPQLLKLHTKLCLLDTDHKLGQNVQSLANDLDLLLLSL